MRKFIQNPRDSTPPGKELFIPSGASPRPLSQPQTVMHSKSPRFARPLPGLGRMHRRSLVKIFLKKISKKFGQTENSP